MNKKNNRQKVFIQLLNNKINKNFLNIYRSFCGIPKNGIGLGGSLKDYDKKIIAEGFSFYRRTLVNLNPKYYDIFTSQEENINQFLYEFFIYGILSLKTEANLNLTGCELFSIKSSGSIDGLVLPQGVYIKIGTNNTINNVKLFLNKNSKKIIKLQNDSFKKGSRKTEKIYTYDLRDKIILQLYKFSIKELLEIYKQYHFYNEIEKISKTKGIEKREKIISVIIKNILKNKVNTGTIRKIVSTKNREI